MYIKYGDFVLQNHTFVRVLASQSLARSSFPAKRTQSEQLLITLVKEVCFVLKAELFCESINWIYFEDTHSILKLMEEGSVWRLVDGREIFQTALVSISPSIISANAQLAFVAAKVSMDLLTVTFYIRDFCFSS